MPTPPPIRRHWFLASTVAAIRRCDQDKGTDISRPSVSKTRKVLSVQLTSTANGSTSMAKVLLPSLLEQTYILFNQPTNLAQFIASKSTPLSQGYWAKPQAAISF
jgi:hypothetical protein